MPDKRAVWKIKNSDGSYSERGFRTKADVVLFNDGSNVEDFKTTANQAIQSRATTVTYNAAIPLSWSSSAPYTQTVSVPGILSTDNPIVDIVLSDDAATAKSELENYGKISDITTNNGNIIIRCLEEKPEVVFNIQLKVVR